MKIKIIGYCNGSIFFKEVPLSKLMRVVYFLQSLYIFKLFVLELSFLS